MKLIRSCVFLVVVAACTPQHSIDENEKNAELILTDGRVYTMDATRAWASSIAIAGGKIIYVGDDAGAEALRSSETMFIDLAGRMVLPSFQDSHIHPISSGMQALSVDLSGTEKLDEYLDIVREYAAAHPEEPWILGGGWSMSTFGPGGKASRKLLDEVVPDRPVFLTSTDGHSGWANSAALKIAGVDEDTPDPPSGIVDRDPDTGEIIGSLQEGAMYLVRAHIPQASLDTRKAGLRYAVDLLNSYGITALQDASAETEDLETYRAVEADGKLNMRVVAAQWWDREQGTEQIELFRNQRRDYTSGRIDAGTVKIMQDGVLENYTAAMLEPYHVPGDPTGIPMVDPEMLKEAVRQLDADGFQVHFHAIGDAAIRQCLDAVEIARAANGQTGNRHHISHLQIIHPDDIPRFRELDVIANFQPLWAYADEYVTELNIPFIGEERASWMYPMRSLVNAGARIAFGSDWFVSTANPFPQIETAITRTDAFGDDEPFIPLETIDLQTALAAFTINAAYLNGLERQTGSIEVGKNADLIVLDRNLFAISPKEISETNVLLTLLEGDVVHGDIEAL